MSSHRQTPYIGVTNNLARRVQQHREGTVPGFTRKYKANHLVYAESFRYIEDDLNREKQIKRWRREKKIDLIMTLNPGWNGLVEEWELLGNENGKIPPLRSG